MEEPDHYADEAAGSIIHLRLLMLETMCCYFLENLHLKYHKLA